MRIIVGLIHLDKNRKPTRRDQHVDADNLAEAISKGVLKFRQQGSGNDSEIVGLGAVDPRFDGSIPHAVVLREEWEARIGDATSPGPQAVVDLNEQEPGRPAIMPPATKLVEPTLDDEAEALLAELKKLAHQFQRLGKKVTDHDYCDGINLGGGILGFVDACATLADKFDEVGLYDSSKGKGFNL